MEKKNKEQILALITTALEKKINDLKESIHHTNSGINDAPGANQSHSDTTKSQLTPVLETAVKSYEALLGDMKLLKGFSRTKEITDGKIVLGAVVIIKKQSVYDRFIILPGGSGVKVNFEKHTYVCITPSSPLAKLLLGKEKGAKINLPHGKNFIQATIEEVL